MMKHIWLMTIAVLLLTLSTRAAESTAFPLPKASSLDSAAFAQYVDGRETPIAPTSAKAGPASVVWTARSTPDNRGVKFGEGRAEGIRHLRIGFTEPIDIGSVLVRGGGNLSVLKADAKYPGNLADDSQWISAVHLSGGEISNKEVGEGEYALWVLPAGTKSRALRFSHVPSAGDAEMAGWIGGVWIVSQRLGNIAPQALVQSRARDDVSRRLVDELHNGWGTWDNGEQGAALAVSPEHPEIITLTWPTPVKLDGVCLLWTGFSAVDVDAFTGTSTGNVHEAPDASWRQMATGQNLNPLYPLPLGPHWLAFDQTVQTRAIRLRILAAAKQLHPHLVDKVKSGHRVWLGELMAVSPLEDRTLASLILPKASEEPPPIPVKFTLAKAGQVTLVIEDMQNHRVRNLVSEMPFPAGENTAWWDGSDDLLRDPEAARHGVYHIPTRMVQPGTYKVRGIWHDPLKLHYEFSIYNAGKPAWETADHTGCWMTTHTPPTSVAIAPASRTADGKPLVFTGAYVAEGGHGLQWLHEDGTKLGGQGWVGGNWTGAPALAVDTGKNAIADHLCYVGSVWEGELRLTAKTLALDDKPVFKSQLGNDPRNNPRTKTKQIKVETLEGFDGGDHVFVLGGIAARDGVIVCSLVRQNQLVVVDARLGTIRSRIEIDNPRGLTFDAEGKLLILSGHSLVRLTSLDAKPQTLIDTGLEDPRHITVDATGNLFITDRGNSHQVKIFSADGKFLRAIGKAGAPSVGPYDPLHLNNPNGLAIDSQGRIWVAEADNAPRRVSVWSADGQLIRAFYGPTEYGGGGVLDPRDNTRFYYKGLEFKLDWTAGTDSLTRVFARPNPLLAAHGGNYSPDTPLYPPAQSGRRYFTSCYTHNPTGQDHVAFIWRDDAKQASLVAAVGDAHSWSILRGPEFRAKWPAGTKPDEENPQPEAHATFVWTDTNGDGIPQPDELKFVKAYCGGVTVMNDLSVILARLGSGSATGANDPAVRLDPSFTNDGVPHYDLSKAIPLGPACGKPVSSGGGQTLTDAGGWTIHTNAPLPYSPYGLGGVLKGEPMWSYPSAWPGLHASHEAAVPDQPGEIVGHTRLLGGFVRGNAGPMFCVNGNMGNMYLLTADGLFVATLFNDIRLRPKWAAPLAVRNMDVTDVSLHDENFWPSITQTSDGRVFLVDGGRTSLVRIDGLETLARLPEQTLTITADDLQRARDWYARAEARRQQQLGTGTLTVPMLKSAWPVDGHVDHWPADTDWAYIDRRGTKANFNSNSRPYEVSAAVALTSTHLYAAWRTTEKDLLNNSGETPNALFKHGGCLDLMLATDPTAAADRPAPVAGDERLLITLVDKKTRALLYRAKVPGTTSPVAFSSPWRTITIDAVEDVSEQVTLATDHQGNYEISIPLAVLHWQPKAGQTYRADLGILRGANGQTTQRVYWSNKATAITADVPSEAELMPRLWGKWKIKEE
jgi:hypothetical protein